MSIVHEITQSYYAQTFVNGLGNTAYTKRVIGIVFCLMYLSLRYMSSFVLKFVDKCKQLCRKQIFCTINGTQRYSQTKTEQKLKYVHICRRRFEDQPEFVGFVMSCKLLQLSLKDVEYSINRIELEINQYNKMLTAIILRNPHFATNEALQLFFAPMLNVRECSGQSSLYKLRLICKAIYHANWALLTNDQSFEQFSSDIHDVFNNLIFLEQRVLILSETVTSHKLIVRGYQRCVLDIIDHGFVFKCLCNLDLSYILMDGVELQHHVLKH